MHLQAFYKGYFAPKYIYVTPGWYNNGWWRHNYGNASCTTEMMLKMLNNSLIYIPNGHFIVEDKQWQSISGLVSVCAGVYSYKINATIIFSQTGEEFEAEYAARLGAERYRDMNLTDFILSGSLYDAMWAIAIGLHNASVHVARNDSIGCDQK